MFEVTDIASSMRTGVSMHWCIKIPMRDGTCLNGTLYLPRDHSAPSAALFTLTPYIGQTWHDFGVYFAAHGYPFLAVDARGRGNSQGDFVPFVRDGADGYDTVEWLAQQPYCNGQVAMWGGSYGGFAQWATAKERPPHLATIVPAAAAYIGVDMPIQNNISMPYLMKWLALVTGRALQDRLFFNAELFWGAQFRQWFESGTAFRSLDAFLGNPSPTFQEWVAHPHQDSYWDSCNPTAEQYARISIPILTITGHCDSDQPGALMHHREHLKNASPASRSQHYLVIGPWDHVGTRTPRREFFGISVGPASLVDLQRLHLEWYTWILKNGKKPEFLRKNVAYYVMVADRWRYVDTLEEVTERSMPLYLRSSGNPTDVFHSGSLTEELPVQSAPDFYVYDPRDIGLAALESTVDSETRADQRMVLAAVGKQLVYHSAPFDRDTEISGFFRFCAWISIDRPDTDFRVSVYDIALDGSSVLLSSDTMRARYRESLRAEKPIRTVEPLRYDFERFSFISRLVKKGNRLRLVVGPINSIYSEKNYNSGGVVSEESMENAQPVKAMLFHDPSHPTALCVPLGAVDTD